VPDDISFGNYHQNNEPPKSRPIRRSPYNFKLYDTEDVRDKLSLIRGNIKQEKQESALKQMASIGGVVRLRKQPRNFSVILNKLEVEYPHFSNVTSKLRKKMKLNSLQKHPFIDFGKGLLLTGPAGTGKSSFLFKLSEGLNTEFYSYSCAVSSSAFDLVGLSAKWGNGSRGKIHELLIEKECPNPIILLDEIEKVVDNDQRFSSLSGALLGLLEKNNARYFRDEFVDQKMDASKINWCATANDASLLTAPIRDRFDVVEVRAPSACELKKMVPSLYKKALAELGVKAHFNPKLGEDIIKLLSLNEGASIRRIKAAIEEGVSNAVDRHRHGEKISIKVEDVSGLSYEDKIYGNPIGFIWDIGGEPSQIH